MLKVSFKMLRPDRKVPHLHDNTALRLCRAKKITSPRRAKSIIYQESEEETPNWSLHSAAGGIRSSTAGKDPGCRPEWGNSQL